MIAALAMSAAAPAAQPPAPWPAPASPERTCTQPRMSEADALRVLRNWDMLDLQVGDVEAATRMIREVDAAECSIKDWPTDLPQRADVRRGLNAALALIRGVEARRSGNLLDASVLQSFAAYMEYVEAARRLGGDAAARVAGISALELMLGDGMRELMMLMPSADVGPKYQELRTLIDDALSNPELATARTKPDLYRFRARTHWLPSGLVRGSDAAAAGEDYKRAIDLYLADGRRDSALLTALDEIDFRLAVNMPEAATQALARLSDRFPSDQLRRRTVFERDAMIAWAAHDHDRLRQASGRWFGSLAVDLKAATAPIWAAGPDTRMQRLFLLAPALGANPKLPEVFDRSAALAKLSRTGRFLIDTPMLAESVPSPEMGNLLYPQDSQLDLREASALDRLGVDAVVMPLIAAQSVGDGRILGQQSGEAEPLYWVVAARPVDGVARTAFSTAESSFDREVLFPFELGRGASSILPAFFQVLLGQPVPPDQMETLTTAFRNEASKDKERAENAFWRAFGAPIDGALGGRCAAGQGRTRDPPPRILLILPTSLDLFPMHLARAPNGRRLIDCYEIRRAPDVETALAAARSRESIGPVRNILGIWNSDEGLNFVRAERSLIAAAAGPGRVTIRSPQGDGAGPLLRPNRAADVIHLAAHGRVGWFDPLRSGFSLPAGKKLRLIDLLSGAETTKVKLVVASACEGGLTSPSFGEIGRFGIPSALLEAGAGGVVTTLWEVRDDATALVMGRFYDLLLEQRLPPAAALREAQLWLRDQSVDGLIAYLSAKEMRVAPADQVEIIRLSGVVGRWGKESGSATPYSDSVFWGGFAYFGTYR